MHLLFNTLILCEYKCTYTIKEGARDLAVEAELWLYSRRIRKLRSYKMECLIYHLIHVCGAPSIPWQETSKKKWRKPHEDSCNLIRDYIINMLSQKSYDGFRCQLSYDIFKIVSPTKIYNSSDWHGWISSPGVGKNIALEKQHPKRFCQYLK